MQLSDDELKSLWQQETRRAAAGRTACLSAELLVRAGEGQLTAAERARVTNHLAECADCAEEYRLARSVNEWAAQSADHYVPAFPTSVVPLTPPPNLWQRLAGQLGRLSSLGPRAVALTAALLLFSLALGIWLLTLKRENRVLVAQLDQQRNAAADKAALRTRIEELQRQQSALNAQAAGQAALQAENEKLKRELAELSQPQLDLPQIDVDPHGDTRGTSSGGKDTVTAINVPALATSFTVNLPGAGSKPFPNYLIELLDAKTNKVVWSGQRRQDKETTFTLTLVKRNLPAGKYRIKVSGLSGKRREPIYNYDIRVSYTTKQ